MILNGNCIEKLKELEDQSVNCCVTSPPYWGLRDYGTAKWVGGDPDCSHKRDSKFSESCSTGQKALEGAIGDGIYKTTCKRCGAVREDEQLGLEETPEEYVDNLVKVFREVKRVLRDDGTLWLNLGDSYCMTSMRGKNSSFNGCVDQSKQGIVGIEKHIPDGLKPKDLVGIPWRVAFALQADGWYLRQDIIWHKPNPMPESVRDRCTKAHEYVFLFSKQERYYFEQMVEPAQYDGRKDTMLKGSQKYNTAVMPNQPVHTMASQGHERWVKDDKGNYVRNKRSVWNVPTRPFKEAHFATFPELLIEPMIQAGCPEFVCNKCGEPRRKIIEREQAPEEVFTKKNSPDDCHSGSHVKGEFKGHGGTLQKWRNEHPDKFLGYTDCGCGEGFREGVVLDPFFGAGTVGVVAIKQGKKYIGIELNKEYIEIANNRINSIVEEIKLQPKSVSTFEW